ncbi:MAG: hypothetical protein R3296_09535 [Oleiphilaceae bacterium]|nr:hypothetical protein [Oleiphilaceae bacterium]
MQPVVVVLAAAVAALVVFIEAVNLLLIAPEIALAVPKEAKLGKTASYKN